MKSLKIGLARTWIVDTSIPVTDTIFTRLKRDYLKHRNSISETGQGLIDEGREFEIEQGSQLANIWGI